MSSHMSRNSSIRGRRDKIWFWPALLGLLYLAVAIATFLVERASELSKIRRGFSTDSVSPFFYTNGVTFPISAIHSNWSGYPSEFSRQGYRDAVNDALTPSLVNIALASALVIVVLTLALATRRRVKPTLSAI
jgi:hypothetical protein